jgi:hypothetical protein
MELFRYTLLADGSSDRSLLPILAWVLAQVPALKSRGVVAQVADLRNVVPPPRTLNDRIAIAIRDAPCELLFVHRDAERQPLAERVQEIRNAALRVLSSDFVPVVPVRMTEAWLLIDQRAIRTAADNPNGLTVLDLPTLNRIQELPNPKARLHNCLKTASEKRGRRLDQFERRLQERVQRVASLIEDFSPLRQLGAFLSFEDATKQAVGRVLGRTAASQLSPPP